MDDATEPQSKFAGARRSGRNPDEFDRTGAHNRLVKAAVLRDLSEGIVPRRVEYDDLDLPYFGCGTTRIYGSGCCQPSGYVALASSSDTAGRMMTSSPCFQLTGVATFFDAVS